MLYNLSSVCTTDKSAVMQQLFHFFSYIGLRQLVKTEKFHNAVFTLVPQMQGSSQMDTSQLICLSPLSDVMCIEYHCNGRLRL